MKKEILLVVAFVLAFGGILFADRGSQQKIEEAIQTAITEAYFMGYVQGWKDREHKCYEDQKRVEKQL